MLPTVDTSADAFMRRILSAPGDPVPRLVFADWLEETGSPSNIAWAHFIRTQVERDALDPWDPRTRDLRAYCDLLRTRIRALLKIPVGTFLRDIPSLLQLLPAENIQVQLTGLAVPADVVEFLPESVVRQHLVMPIGWSESRLILAAVEPRQEPTAEALQFILNRELVIVRAEESQIRAAIDHHYGNRETESVDEVLVLFPESDRSITFAVPEFPTGDEPPVNRLVHLLLAEALRSADVTGLEVEPTVEAVRVWHRVGPERTERDLLPRRLAGPVTARLRALAALPPVPVPGRTEAGEILHFFDGRWYGLPLRIAPGAHGPVAHVQILPPLPPTAVNPAA